MRRVFFIFIAIIMTLILSAAGLWAAPPVKPPTTEARLTALESAVTTLQSQVSTLQTQVVDGISVVVHGRIGYPGNSGTGFSSTSIGNGRYNVSFIKPFSTTPRCFAEADEQFVMCSAVYESTNTNGTQIWCRQPAAGYQSLWYDSLGIPYLTIYGLTPWTWEGGISFICVQ